MLFRSGVTYVDAVGREFEQPAALIVTSMFALNNVRMLLLSGVGTPYDPNTRQGVVGRNYSYQTVSSAAVFFDDDVTINPFMASGASGTVINDFAADNFDHSGLGFIGGAYVGAVNSHGRPIQFHPVPPGTAAWGKDWKQPEELSCGTLGPYLALLSRAATVGVPTLLHETASGPTH